MLLRFLCLVGLFLSAPSFANEGTGTADFCARHGCNAPPACPPVDCGCGENPLIVNVAPCPACPADDDPATSCPSIDDIRHLLYRFHLEKRCIERVNGRCRKHGYVLIDP